MAVPRSRVSNARKNSRRAHHAKNPRPVATCTNCGSHRLPHCLCPSCGHYNGRSVVRSAESGA